MAPGDGCHDEASTRANVRRGRAISCSMPSQPPLASIWTSLAVSLPKMAESGLANAFSLAQSSIALWHASAHDKQGGIDDHSTTVSYSSVVLEIL